MKFVLGIYAAPYASQGVATAWSFAQALIEQQHHIEQIFFAESGVINAAATIEADINWPQLWQTFARDHQIHLRVCYPSAKKYGIDQLMPEFAWGGLTQFAQALLIADRHLIFG